MTVICFTNPGEIDPLLITTMGVNVKENSNPIGHFGTGLKYAIATIMRLGGKMTIQSGNREFTFSTRSRVIRNKPFDFIEMKEEGESLITLGFTAELGKHWEPWMAYRELYCNTLDEKGITVALSPSADIYAPTPNVTRIFIDEPNFTEIHENPKLWLLPQAALLLWSTSAVECYTGPSTYGFYHGIKVVEFTKPAAFTYNIVDQRELTEDRTMPYHIFAYVVTSEILRRDRAPIPPSVLHRILAAKRDTLEHDFYWSSYIRPNDEVIAAPAMTPHLRASMTAYLPPPPFSRSVFDDLDEEAPPTPTYTCSYINIVQAILRDSISALALAEEAHETDGPNALLALCKGVQNELTDLMDNGKAEGAPLEHLRQLNEDLRDAGKYWRETCKRRTQNIRSPHSLDTEVE